MYFVCTSKIKMWNRWILLYKWSYQVIFVFGTYVIVTHKIGILIKFKKNIGLYKVLSKLDAGNECNV